MHLNASQTNHNKHPYQHTQTHTKSLCDGPKLESFPLFLLRHCCRRRHYFRNRFGSFSASRNSRRSGSVMVSHTSSFRFSVIGLWSHASTANRSALALTISYATIGQDITTNIPGCGRTSTTPRVPGYNRTIPSPPFDVGSRPSFKNIVIRIIRSCASPSSAQSIDRFISPNGGSAKNKTIQ